jgi:hypothetical protein
MTQGDAVAGLGVRVRLDGRATGKDIRALKKWLEQETPLAEMVRESKLRIELQGRPDAPQGQGHMGLETEIILKMIDASTTVTLTMLLEHTVRAVRAWRANRERVETGEQPEPHVDRLNSDAPPTPGDPGGPVDRPDPSKR